MDRSRGDLQLDSRAPAKEIPMEALAGVAQISEEARVLEVIRSLARQVANQEKELGRLRRQIHILASPLLAGPDDNNKEDTMTSLLLTNPGATYEEIGDLMGLSKQRIHEIAKRAGLERDTRTRNYHSYITTGKVLELYHKNLLIKDIAQALGCAEPLIRRRLRAAGISKRDCYSRSMKLAWRGKGGAKAIKRTN